MLCESIIYHFSRPRDDGSGLYELVQKLDFMGAVEGLAFAKVRRTADIGCGRLNTLHSSIIYGGTGISIVCCKRLCVIRLSAS